MSEQAGEGMAIKVGIIVTDAGGEAIDIAALGEQQRAQLMALVTQKASQVCGVGGLEGAHRMLVGERVVSILVGECGIHPDVLLLHCTHLVISQHVKSAVGAMEAEASKVMTASVADLKRLAKPQGG